MATVRIYKVAELLNTSSQEVMALLKRDHGIDVKSASSTIEEVVARQFVERLARQRNITVPSSASFADTPAAVRGRKPAGQDPNRSVRRRQRCRRRASSKPPSRRLLYRSSKPSPRPRLAHRTSRHHLRPVSAIEVALGVASSRRTFPSRQPSSNNAAESPAEIEEPAIAAQAPEPASGGTGTAQLRCGRTRGTASARRRQTGGSAADWACRAADIASARRGSEDRSGAAGTAASSGARASALAGIASRIAGADRQPEPAAAGARPGAPAAPGSAAARRRSGQVELPPRQAPDGRDHVRCPLSRFVLQHRRVRAERRAIVRRRRDSAAARRRRRPASRSIAACQRASGRASGAAASHEDDYAR